MALIKLNNRAVKDVTEFGSISSLGSLTHISTATASASASIEFSLGDLKEYVFYFNNIHAGTRGDYALTLNFSTDSGSNYNVSKISTYFRTYHAEDGGGGLLTYDTGRDSAGGLTTSDIKISNSQTDTDDNHSASGYLHLFNPSSTTFVKHFMSNISEVAYTGGGTGSEIQTLVAGYGNTTSAIDAVKFQMSSGNIDAGQILLFGVN
jgi:hypothetical protein